MFSSQLTGEATHLCRQTDTRLMYEAVHGGDQTVALTSRLAANSPHRLASHRVGFNTLKPFVMNNVCLLGSTILYDS